MAEKGKSHGTGAKSRLDKSREPSRAQGRQSKKPSHKTHRPTPSPDAVSPPPEPLDVGSILEDLLDRVLAEHVVATAARQRVPFAVARARDAVLFVTEWEFLVRDEGDPDCEGDSDPERDGVWGEDEEPQRCPCDCWVLCDEDCLSLEKGPSEELPAAAEAGAPLEGPGDVSDAVPVLAVPLSPDQGPSEDLVVTAKAGAPLVCPSEVPDAVPVLAVPLPPDQVPAAAAAASPAQVLGADTVPVPGPALREPPIAPQPPERGRQLSRAPGRGSIPAQTPRRGSRPSRPPAPRPAPPDAPRARSPLPSAPSEAPAQAGQEGTAKLGHQVPPPPSSPCPGAAPVQPRRASRGTGLPRLAARRLAARWVLPEVRVKDVTGDPERARSEASRSRLVPSGFLQVLPGPGRARRAAVQLCDPWLASARLAPGVTVRWGRSERRGPPPPGHGEDLQDEEALRRAEQELKPILAYPVCRLSDYGE
ncbi:uncharacterized protein C2orf81 homolog isoform X2 [Prinia subflava]|uniref:uncharacterized protein C2orf81 homolog isoform X2 n=1 Tax=Prinia subflava TaxID=208062 RepID=UPI002FE3B1FB